MKIGQEIFKRSMEDYANNASLAPNGGIYMSHKDFTNLVWALSQESNRQGVLIDHEMVVKVDESREPYLTFITPRKYTQNIVTRLNSY